MRPALPQLAPEVEFGPASAHTALPAVDEPRFKSLPLGAGDQPPGTCTVGGRFESASRGPRRLWITLGIIRWPSCGYLVGNLTPDLPSSTPYAVRD